MRWVELGLWVAGGGLRECGHRSRTPYAILSRSVPPEHLACVGHEPVELLDVALGGLDVAFHLHDERIALLGKRHIQSVAITSPRRRPLLVVALLEALLVRRRGVGVSW